jgi:hypothetical protein
MPPMDKQQMCPCAPWDESDDAGDGENKEMEAPKGGSFCWNGGNTQPLYESDAHSFFLLEIYGSQNYSFADIVANEADSY